MAAELVKYVCPKCGHKTKQLSVVLEVAHQCKQNENRLTKMRLAS
jgi:hypothetical protein